MVFYFRLQLKRMQRKLLDLGVPPIIGIAIAIITFIALSVLIYYKTDYADWIVAFFGVLFVLKLADNNRNHTLKAIFRNNNYLRIRVIENGAVIIPFVIVLLFFSNFMLAFGLLLASILIALININFRTSFTLPTPFKRIPFEFIVGYRKSFGAILLAYFIAVKAIEVGNFNLGIFSLALIFLIAMSFYFQPEKTYFVWIFACNSKQFLVKKILHALLGSTILSLPILMVIALKFPDQWFVLTMVLVLGYFYLSSMVLAKYSAYPEEMSVPQGLLYGLSLWFPPMLLFILPVFYRKSLLRLKPYLQ
jgi:hypothetical protein